MTPEETQTTPSAALQQPSKKKSRLKRAGLILILLGLLGIAMTFLSWDSLAGMGYDGISILLVCLFTAQLGVTFAFHNKKAVFYICCVFHMLLGELILMTYALFGGLIYVILHVFANGIVLILWSMNLFWTPSKKQKKHA